MTEKVERRLAAILAADVVGYSRMMAADEAGTLARLKACRRELIDPAISEHKGRLVKLMGDGALVEFASAVEAAECAVSIQQAVADRSMTEPEDRRIVFRVGINLGEIIVDDNDIYGDGVNVAARMEQLAEPGGVCISGEVYRQVRGRIDVEFRDLGDQQVKNIPEPIHAYSIPINRRSTSGLSASPTNLPLPSKPSIAVLPFANMSGDPEQEYFADGIADDILTGLSRFPELFVIARNSSFTYKGRAVDIKQVGRELGVRYVLEGSVRRAGNRVRITGQLIEAESGNHLWAEKYDGDLADVFDLQDEITASVVGVIQPTVFLAEIDRAKRKRTENLDAYDLQLRGWSSFFGLSREGFSEARNYARKAIDTDPGYVTPRALMAWAFLLEFMFGWSDDPGKTLAQARKAAEEALQVDEGDANAHVVLAFCLLWGRSYDQARLAAKRAIELNPNSSTAYFAKCAVDGYTRNAKAGLEAVHNAMRLSPRDPFRWGFLNGVIICHIALRNHELALEAASELAALRPDYIFGHANMAVCCGHLYQRH